MAIRSSDSRNRKLVPGLRDYEIHSDIYVRKLLPNGKISPVLRTEPAPKLSIRGDITKL